MKGLKRIILVVVCVIIILILALIYILDGSEENEEAVENIESIGSEPSASFVESEQVFKKVSNAEEYFEIKNILSNYFIYVQQLNGDVYIDTSRVDNIEETIQTLQQESIEVLSGMLAEEYKEEFDITDELIKAEADKYVKAGEYTNSGIGYTTIIQDLSVLYISETEKLFLVELKVDDLVTNLLIKLDFTNSTFSIFLEDYVEKYGYTDEITAEENVITSGGIEANDYNEFTQNTISTESMAREYFSLLKTILLNDSERMYDLLDDEYKSARFTDYDDFEEYVNNMYDKLSSANLSKYYKDGNTYNLLDDNGLVYSVQYNRENIIDLTIMLDDYTIYTDEFIESYNSATDEEKVQTDIETFFKMINTCDYRSAYNLLNDTFRENNFSTLDDFVEYAKNNFFENTTITGVDSISQSGTYYVCTFNTASSSDEDSADVETDSETFIVSLGSGTDFELSFTVE